MKNRVHDLNLAERGLLSVAWAESRMPVMMALRERFAAERPLAGHRIVGSTHVTKETAVLVRTLQAAGAEVSWCPSNPLTTQDAVAAAIAKDASIFAWHGMSRDEYYWAQEQAILAAAPGPTLALDDGGDMLILLHTRFPELAANVRGGTDKTTTGVDRLRALARAGKLSFPIIAVNDAITKWELDNVHGTGQSAIDGILRATGVLLAGKAFVVGGFGHVGRGTAMRAKGLGARVIVTEVLPTSALNASMEGFEVLSMDDAAALGDVFCTATGMKDIIVGRHLDRMKDGAILSNVGHFDCEINLADLEARLQSRREVRPGAEECVLHSGRRLYLLGKGRVINLAAAEGNPSEVMDLTFATQVLALLELASDGGQLDRRVHPFSSEQDEAVARLKLETLGVRTDQWTEEQRRYATSLASNE